MNRIEEIRERLNKATPGPWDRHRYSVEDWNGNQVCGDFTNEEDKAFIAHAPDDIKYLLEQLTALQEDYGAANKQVLQLKQELSDLYSDNTTLKSERDHFKEHDAGAMKLLGARIKQIDNLLAERDEMKKAMEIRDGALKMACNKLVEQFGNHDDPKEFAEYCIQQATEELGK
jgi:chromosome segregation ATPase